MNDFAIIQMAMALVWGLGLTALWVWLLGMIGKAGPLARCAFAFTINSALVVIGQLGTGLQALPIAMGIAVYAFAAVAVYIFLAWRAEQRAQK